MNGVVIIPARIPRTRPKRNANYNPIRRLFAAIIIRALRDLRDEKVSDDDKASAIEFLYSNADALFLEFDIPETKVRLLLQSLDQS